MKEVAQFNSKGQFVGITHQYDAYMPNGCIELTDELRELGIQIQKYQAIKYDRNVSAEEKEAARPKYAFIRDKVSGQITEVEDNTGVQYYLPSDTYGDSPHVMRELGPLPALATFTAPAMPESMVADQVRAIRDAKIAETDWTQLPDAQSTMSTDQVKVYQDYRQALRDLPEKAGFPWDGKNIPWPELKVTTGTSDSSDQSTIETEPTTESESADSVVETTKVTRKKSSN